MMTAPDRSDACSPAFSALCLTLYLDAIRQDCRLARRTKFLKVSLAFTPAAAQYHATDLARGNDGVHGWLVLGSPDYSHTCALLK